MSNYKTYEEYKSLIGEKAKQEIAAQLGFKNAPNGEYHCGFKIHTKSNPVLKWNGKSFKCFNCGESADIIDVAFKQAEPISYLCGLAGLEYQEKVINVQGMCRENLDNGMEYLINQRGLSRKAIADYYVANDNNNIYFYNLNFDRRPIACKIRVIGNVSNGQNKYSAVKDGKSALYGTHLYQNQKTLIITEGEIDCLTMYDICNSTNSNNDKLCCSLPNGSKSIGVLKEQIDFIKRFENIILVPDNDTAGKEFLLKAEEILDGLELYHFDTKDCNDVNELYLKMNKQVIFSKYIRKIEPVLDGIFHSTEIQYTNIINNGYISGYVTYDYNDNGLKAGNLTILTGSTNAGKTSYTRQMLLTLSMQNIKSFMFIGEASVDDEKKRLARLCATKDEIESHHGTGGRTIFIPNTEAQSRYDDKYGKNILISDFSNISKIAKKKEENVFNILFKEMKKMARLGVKVFLLDNLMVLCSSHGSKLNLEQKTISETLKIFAVQNKVTVLLICHQRGGEGHQRISGAQEIANLADTIVRYVRIFDDTKESTTKNLPIDEEYKDRISAMVITEKIRDEGSMKMAYLEWEETNGALYELSTLDKAKEYEVMGYWTRHIPKYNSSYEPSDYKEASYKN